MSEGDLDTRSNSNESSSQDEEEEEEEEEDMLLNDVSSEQALENLRQNEAFALTEEERKCHKTAEQYIQNCLHFHMKVDPAVVIALRTGWDVLHPTRHFNDGSMLSLVGILEDSKKIRKINFANVGMQDSRFRASGNGNSNARVLSHVLQKNKWIEELDLSNNGLDDDGIREIASGLARNESVKHLNLSSNHFSELGAMYLSQAIRQNSVLRKLDLSRNALGFRSISILRSCCEPKDIEVDTFGNYVFEEILNSVTHGVAFLGSVIGAHVLISDTLEVYKTDYHFWASVIYSFSLMFLFLSSCLFHSFFMLPTTMRILQILDHVGIYLVIAGSYTPILLISLHNFTSARVLLVAEWLGALFGMIFATCSDLNNPTTTLVELIVFLSMGCGCLMILPLMIEQLSRECLMLALIGGLFYVSGIVFFILGEYKPIYHVIWHIFVVIAATVHWFNIYFYVVQVDLHPHSSAKAMVEDFVDTVSSAASAVDSMMQAAGNMTGAF